MNGVQYSSTSGYLSKVPCLLKDSCSCKRVPNNFNTAQEATSRQRPGRERPAAAAKGGCAAHCFSAVAGLKEAAGERGWQPGRPGCAHAGAHSKISQGVLFSYFSVLMHAALFEMKYRSFNQAI